VVNNITKASCSTDVVTDDSNKIAFCYPRGKGISSLFVRNGDVARLDPNRKEAEEKYLSDTAMDFVVKHILASNPVRLEGWNPFVCSSLFYSHIRSMFRFSEGDPEVFVTSWYETVIHDHNMILSVVHGRTHFSGVSILDPWYQPVICHYDPMVHYHSEVEVMETFSAYLKSNSHKAFLSDEIIPEPKFVKLKGPVQKNSFDCGLFVLEFIQRSVSFAASSSHSDDPYANFNEHSWTQEDIDYKRAYYFDLMTELSRQYTNLENLTDDSSSSDDQSALMVVSNQQPPPPALLSASDEEKYEKDRVFEDFLVSKFGSIPAYISRVPSVKDQDLLRSTFDEKRDLLANWSTKRSGINCGYIGSNKEQLYIFEKFIYEPCLNWAPTNSHAYDACPHDRNRAPDLYGYQSHLAIEVLGKLYICGWSLFSEDLGHRYILWTFNWTLCWDPRKDWILYDTHTETFTIVQGNIFRTLVNTLFCHILYYYHYYYVMLLDEFVRSMETDLDHRYDGLDLHEPNVLVQKYMNWICMKGLKYDPTRHIKRTSMHYFPGKVDYSKVDPGDLIPDGESRDWLSILINGQRNPEDLKEYYATKISGTNQ
jgi:hypothetical protein